MLLNLLFSVFFSMMLNQATEEIYGEGNMYINANMFNMNKAQKL